MAADPQTSYKIKKIEISKEMRSRDTKHTSTTASMPAFTRCSWCHEIFKTSIGCFTAPATSAP